MNILILIWAVCDPLWLLGVCCDVKLSSREGVQLEWAT